MARYHHVCGGLLLSETHTDAVMYAYRVKNVMQMARTGTSGRMDCRPLRLWQGAISG